MIRPSFGSAKTEMFHLETHAYWIWTTLHENEFPASKLLPKIKNCSIIHCLTFYVWDWLLGGAICCISGVICWGGEF